MGLESRILVTGGAGFIGSHMVDRLMAEDYDVVVLDNFSVGQKKYVEKYMGKSAFRLIKGDIRDEKTVLRAVDGVDAVLHMAAIVSVTRSVEDPILTDEVNVRGTLNLLKDSLDAGAKRFIYPSSTAVYGDSQELPLKEETVTNPISPYGASKLASEQYCRVFYNTYGLETVILRYFNVYGPRQKKGPYSGAITNFVYGLLEGKPPVIYGDGHQTRDFIHVDDVVEANMLALKNEGVAGETFNIATGTPTTINDLAHLLIELMEEKASKPVHDKPRKGDIRHNYADTTKAQSILGFEAAIGLREGLDRLLEYK